MEMVFLLFCRLLIMFSQIPAGMFCQTDFAHLAELQEEKGRGEISPTEDVLVGRGGE